MKEAFCKLFTNLWIEIYPYNKADFRMNVYSWEEPDDKIILPCSRYDVSKLKEVKMYILNFLKNKTKSQVHSQKNNQIIKQRISYLNTIIKLVIKMIKLGFYNDLYEISLLSKRVKLTLNRSFRQFDTLSLALSKLSDNPSESTFRKGAQGIFNISVLKMIDKGTIEVLRDCRVVITQFFDIIIQLDILVKKFPLMFRVKNLVSSSLRQDEFIKETFRSEFEDFSEDYKDEVREAIEGKKDYMNSQNYESYVESVGELIAETSKNDSLITTLKDEGFIESLLALSFEENLEIKRLCFKIIFSLFQNTFKLTTSLNEFLLLRKENQDVYESLKKVNNRLIEGIDFMNSFRTTNNNKINENLEYALNEL